MLCGPRVGGGLSAERGNLQMLDWVEPGGRKSLVGEASEQEGDPHLRHWTWKPSKEEGHSQGGATVCALCSAWPPGPPWGLGMGTLRHASLFFLDFLHFP